LDYFDLSDRFVDVFKVFPFLYFKASTLAKAYLDEVEFDTAHARFEKAEKALESLPTHKSEGRGKFRSKKVGVDLIFPK